MVLELVGTVLEIIRHCWVYAKRIYLWVEKGIQKTLWAQDVK